MSELSDLSANYSVCYRAAKAAMFAFASHRHDHGLFQVATDAVEAFLSAREALVAYLQTHDPKGDSPFDPPT